MGHTDRITGLKWDGRGSFITSSLDGYVRTWAIPHLRSLSPVVTDECSIDESSHPAPESTTHCECIQEIAAFLDSGVMTFALSRSRSENCQYGSAVRLTEKNISPKSTVAGFSSIPEHRARSHTEQSPSSPLPTTHVPFTHSSYPNPNPHSQSHSQSQLHCQPPSATTDSKGSWSSLPVPTISQSTTTTTDLECDWLSVQSRTGRVKIWRRVII